MNIEEMKQSAATHEQFAARLEALMNGPQDVAELPVSYHRALNLTLHVGPLSGPEYDAWQAQIFIEKQQHKTSGAKENGAPLNTKDSDAFLLQKAVWTSDGQLLGADKVAKMLKAPKCGASNFALVQAAKAQNPPREQLSGEAAVAFACNQTTIILWELLFKIGKGGALVDVLAPSATPEEKAEARRQIQKAQESVYVLRPWLDTVRAAARIGITLEEAAKKVAFDAIEDVRAGV